MSYASLSSEKMFLTYQFRIKDSARVNQLMSLAGKTNFVWNFFNESSLFAWKRDRKWLSEFDLSLLAVGSSTLLGLHSDSINSIAKEFCARRNKAKSPSLRWRSSKRKLGWIPFKGRAIRIDGDSLVFQKTKYKLWKSRDIDGEIKSGSFNQNAKGQWFVSLHCEVSPPEPTKNTKSVGIDLGLETLASFSDGSKIENPRTLSKWADKLARAQRANKRRQVAALHTKIKNIRKDFLHKESTKAVNEYGKIVIGNVSSSKLARTKMAKSVFDASWGLFKSMLAYKAHRLGVDFSVVQESYSSVTCSVCLERSGPSGLSSLGVREWICLSCGVVHDRDINAAQNILLGLER